MAVMTQNAAESIPRAMLNAYKLSGAFNEILLASCSDRDFRGADEAFSEDELEQLNRLCQKAERILNTRMSILFSQL